MSRLRVWASINIVIPPYTGLQKYLSRQQIFDSLMSSPYPNLAGSVYQPTTGPNHFFIRRRLSFKKRPYVVCDYCESDLTKRLSRLIGKDLDFILQSEPVPCTWTSVVLTLSYAQYHDLSFKKAYILNVVRPILFHLQIPIGVTA